jgi:hypothetical protein
VKNGALLGPVTIFPCRRMASIADIVWTTTVFTEEIEQDGRPS